MRMFRISIDVASNKVGTISGLLVTEGTNLQVTEIEAPHNRRRAPANGAAPRTRASTALPITETRTGKIICDHLHTHGPAKPGALGLILQAAGFNQKTASPICSRLIAEGVAVRLSDGRVSLTQKEPSHHD